MEKKINILVVDDILVNRLLIKEIVKKMNAQCYEAENGRVAIEILLSQSIDLIFMDIEMPVMNGLETTRYIREKAPLSKQRVPIIALTAHDPATFFDDFKDAGFDKLLTKPYSVTKVQTLIREVSPAG